MSVDSLYQQLVSEGNIVDTTHAYDGALASHITPQIVGEIHHILKTRAGKARLTGRYDGGLMCLLVLCFDRYSLHEGILKIYNNDMIYALWCVIEFCYSHPDVRPSTNKWSWFIKLVNNRSPVGFRQSHGRGSSNSAIRLTSTSIDMLNLREHNIENRQGNEVIVNMNGSTIATSSIIYYRSFEHMIRDVTEMNISQFRDVDNSPPCYCNDAISCLVNSRVSPVRSSFCPVHGIRGARDVVCNIMVRDDQYRHLRVYDDQTICPHVFYDNPCILPDCVHNVMNSLIDNMLHLEPDHFNGVDTSHRSCRGVIVHSCLKLDDTMLMIWSVRPTINWIKVRIDDTRVSVHADMSIIRNLISNTSCPFDISKDTSFNSIDDDRGNRHLVVSGRCAAYLLPPYQDADDLISISSVSFGSSTLQFTMMENIKSDSPLIRPLCCNINVVSTLLRQNLPIGPRCRYSHMHRDNCVSIKHLETQLSTKGSSMVVGKHGGMQWIGKLSSFTNDFGYVCSTINRNSQSLDFKSMVSNMSVMNRPVYPSGVSRKS